jgi:hypothetical protein
MVVVGPVDISHPEPSFQSVVFHAEGIAIPAEPFGETELKAEPK